MTPQMVVALFLVKHAIILISVAGWSIQPSSKWMPGVWDTVKLRLFQKIIRKFRYGLKMDPLPIYSTCQTVRGVLAVSVVRFMQSNDLLFGKISGM